MGADGGFGVSGSGACRAAGQIGEMLTGRSLMTTPMLERVMAGAYGAPAATGVWSIRDAFDALEAGAVLAAARLPQGEAAETLVRLQDLEKRLPTQARRTEEQMLLQQFSTPLPYAHLATVAAGLTAQDVVLEPSAGTGMLALFAKRAGARLILNELSPSRRALLEMTMGRRAFGHDAGRIDDLLDRALAPTVVLMNPPFSSSLKGEDAATGGRHLWSAFRRLAPGGRLVAIMPERFGRDRKDPVWRKLEEEGCLRLRAVVDGRVYRKQGTTIDTALIVADKIAPEGEMASASAATLEELLAVIAALPPRRDLAAPAPLAVVSGRPIGTAALPRPSSAPARAAAAVAEPEIQYAPLDLTPLAPDVSGVYAAWSPRRFRVEGANPHPTPLVESLAMASVIPPMPSYRPRLPRSLLERGELSEAQIESVIYAGEAHSAMLPGLWRRKSDWSGVAGAKDGAWDSSFLADDKAVYRRGWFLGDGTGCGKGRQIAAIILDNWLQGRRKAIWVSKNDKLFEDAVRDWTDLGGAPTDVKALADWSADEPVSARTGILFVTYGLLRSVSRKGVSRLDQIIAWCGPDFDGVVAFDEAHALANAAAGEGETGEEAMGFGRTSSQQGIAGLRLQCALPGARMLYVSATGATSVENLAYVERLGLWALGQGDEEATLGAPFCSRGDFISAMTAGGVAAMEVVARDLKALGLYAARALSFEGVDTEMLEHPLTAADRAVYDAWADAFGVIHENLEEAMRAVCEELGKSASSGNGRVKSRILSQFESMKQRFFGHLITSMKARTVIRAIRADLEAGHSAVVQIVSTGEAHLARRLAEVEEDEKNDLNLDLTPKDAVLDWLDKAFPVHLMEEVKMEDGSVTLQQAKDANGAPIVSREAEALRDAMVGRLATLDAAPAALDQIIHAFGADQVAEVTGRGQRTIWTGSGSARRLVAEKRAPEASTEETRAFMAGRKRILVFSQAGGTGRSYHAALTARNQQRRIHYLLEAGWKADAAIQGLGRSHRSAQASAPLYRIVSSDVQGERRFISTIARRLDTLGALTKGQRQTGGANLFKEEDNLESPVARRALRAFLVGVAAGETASLSAAEIETLLHLKADRLEEIPMATFLNRVLALRIDRQNSIMAEFGGLFETMIRDSGSH